MQESLSGALEAGDSSGADTQRPTLIKLAEQDE
jgi:hypothetical protein